MWLFIGTWRGYKHSLRHVSKSHPSIAIVEDSIVGPDEIDAHRPCSVVSVPAGHARHAKIPDSVHGLLEDIVARFEVELFAAQSEAYFRHAIEIRALVEDIQAR